MQCNPVIRRCLWANSWMWLGATTTVRIRSVCKHLFAMHSDLFEERFQLSPETKCRLQRKSSLVAASRLCRRLFTFRFLRWQVWCVEVQSCEIHFVVYIVDSTKPEFQLMYSGSPCTVTAKRLGGESTGGRNDLQWFPHAPIAASKSILPIVENTYLKPRPFLI